jgi:hypothetical protein
VPGRRDTGTSTHAQPAKNDRVASTTTGTRGRLAANPTIHHPGNLSFDGFNDSRSCHADCSDLARTTPFRDPAKDLQQRQANVHVCVVEMDIGQDTR